MRAPHLEFLEQPCNTSDRDTWSAPLSHEGFIGNIGQVIITTILLVNFER